MPTSEDNKKSIAFKIKALLAKTTQAGCSEAEAMMAAHITSGHYIAGHQAGGEARFSRPVSRDEFETRQLPGPRQMPAK